MHTQNCNQESWHMNKISIYADTLKKLIKKWKFNQCL